MISAIALVFVINVVTSVLKRWIYPSYGKLGVQVVAFIAAAIAALYVAYRQEFPGMEEFVMTALALFSSTIAIYEVVLQNISWFKVNTPEVEEARAIEKKISLMQ